MNLRIGYITSQYPRSSDTFIRREVDVLRQSGVHVNVMSIRRPASDEGASSDRQAEQRRTSYILPCSPIRLVRCHFGILLRSPLRYLSGLGLALRVRPAGLRGLVWSLFYFAEAAVVAGAMRRDRLVHLHNHFCDGSGYVAMFAAHIGGFGFSFTVHGPGEFFAPAEIRLDEKIRRALFVVCISHFCRSQCMVWSSPDDWNRLHIVHCGVDPELFEPVEHVSTGARLLYVGRLARVKGLPILLRAIASMKERQLAVHLTLVGDGPERTALESLAQELRISEQLTFTGSQSEAEVRRWLARSDVFVLPSFAEGLPVVLMEAMASSLPVVATRIAGVSELVVDGRNGFLVPPSDVAALARRIEELIPDAALRQEMGRAGRRKVAEEFDVKREGARLLRIMRAAIASRIEGSCANGPGSLSELPIGPAGGIPVVKDDLSG